MRIVLITHYFPPINSSGAKRVESLSKYWALMGHEVAVITTIKSLNDGDFTEVFPDGVLCIEVDAFGRHEPSVASNGRHEPMYSKNRSWKRRLKDFVMAVLGQIPDPRIPFALSFSYPWLSSTVKDQIRNADVIVATTPPWSILLAGYIAKVRFKKKLVLDYRDHFSDCHEMPGSRLAKYAEKKIDRFLARSADYLVCVSDPMTDYYRVMNPRTVTITNGYDRELLERSRLSSRVISDDKVRIRYMGIVSFGRVPHGFFKALLELNELNPELLDRLRIEFYGNAAIIHELVSSVYSKLKNNLYFYDPIPYFDSLKAICEADYLLFSETSNMTTPSAKGILTTKLFEYIGSGRPVIAHIKKETLAGSLLFESGPDHTITEDSADFLIMLRNENFYKRVPDSISPLALSLSRESKAIEYLRILKEVFARGGRVI